MNEKNEHINVVIAVAAFLLIVTGVALIGNLVFGDEPETLGGQVEARQYNVSTKLTARVVRVCVEEGDYVHCGDTLAVLESPEMAAQEAAAQATQGAAQALSEMTDNGNRREQIQSSDELLQQALAAQTIAEKTYRRMQHLYDEGVTTAQKRDEALAAYQVADAQVRAAQSRLEMMVNGARKEEKQAAAQQANAARHGTDVVRSLLRETVQVAAADGEVDKIYAHTGELVSGGSPIMAINLLDDVWGTFNIREDQLHGLHVGSVVKAYSPAFKKEYPLQVYFMKGEESFATWKATKADKGYDIRTFEVRARPLRPSQGLRPGMLLILKNEDVQHD